MFCKSNAIALFCKDLLAPPIFSNKPPPKLKAIPSGLYCLYKSKAFSNKLGWLRAALSCTCWASLYWSTVILPSWYACSGLTPKGWELVEVYPGSTPEDILCILSTYPPSPPSPPLGAEEDY